MISYENCHTDAINIRNKISNSMYSNVRFSLFILAVIMIY